MIGSSRRDAALFVLLAGLAFASSGPVARYARPADPLVVTFGRLAVAAVALLLLERKRVAPSLRALDRRSRLAVVLAGLLLAAHFALFLVGLDRTSLPAAMSLISLQPLAVVVTAWVLFAIRPTRMERAGVIIATLGAAIVARGSGVRDHSLYGDSLVVGAVVLYGFYLAVARALRDAIGSRVYAAFVYSVAALAMAVVLVATRRAGAIATLEPHSIMAIVALGLVPTVIGHTAVQTASRTLSPSTVALVSPGETAGAIAIGAIFMGAEPTLLELAGAAVIVAGAVLGIIGKKAGASEGEPVRR